MGVVLVMNRSSHTNGMRREPVLCFSETSALRINRFCVYVISALTADIFLCTLILLPISSLPLAFLRDFAIIESDHTIPYY